MMQILSPEQNSTSTNTLGGSTSNKYATNFESFYDKYAGALYGEIKRGLFEEEVSQKVMETACRKLYESLDTFDSSKEKMFIYALKLVKKEIGRKKINITLNQILFSQTRQQKVAK